MKFFKKKTEAEKSLDASKVQWWDTLTPKQKHRFIISSIFVSVSIAGLFIIAFAREIFGSASDQFLGQSDNGFVAISKWFKTNTEPLVNTLLIILLTFLISYVLMLIVKGLTIKGKKAKTIGSLIRSFIKYVAIIIAIFAVLSTWGVDVTTLLASLGVLTLIIGLGCQTLISDVVSGLFLVFDDSFNVGDIVVIDNFRGTVQEIGLRSTRIIDAGGNVKAINNSSISTVVNLTDELSVAVCDCDISYNESIERVEAVISKNLPTISKKIKSINNGPYYKGIAVMGDSGITLRFIAECKEEDKFQVVRDLNREIYIMFTNNDVLIPYPQIVVNPPDKKSVEPTLKDKKASEKFIREQKELSSGIGPISNLDGEDGSVK